MVHRINCESQRWIFRTFRVNDSCIRLMCNDTISRNRKHTADREREVYPRKTNSKQNRNCRDIVSDDDRRRPNPPGHRLILMTTNVSGRQGGKRIICGCTRGLGCTICALIGIGRSRDLGQNVVGVRLRFGFCVLCLVSHLYIVLYVCSSKCK